MWIKLYPRRKRRLIDTYVTKIKPAPEESRPSSVLKKTPQAAEAGSNSEKEVAVGATG